MTIPATIPQRSEIPAGLLIYPVHYVAFTLVHKKQMTGPHVQFGYLKEKLELLLVTRKPEAEEFYKELRNLR